MHGSIPVLVVRENVWQSIEDVLAISCAVRERAVQVLQLF